jgi:hypothetical protein
MLLRLKFKEINLLILNIKFKNELLMDNTTPKYNNLICI